MRYIVSGLTLLATVLDFRFGRPAVTLQLGGLISGLLLALSIIIDWILPPDTHSPVGPSVALGGGDTTPSPQQMS